MRPTILVLTVICGAAALSAAQTVDQGSTPPPLIAPLERAPNATPPSMAAPSTTAAPRTAAAGVPILDSEQWAFLILINSYRAQNGAGPLKVSITLQSSSQWMSEDMAAEDYVNHTDSLGRSADQRIAAFGYTHYPWGENIAAGYSTAQAVFDGWENACDPDTSGSCTYGHRVNMLSGAFKVLGIGRAGSMSSYYDWYWTTDFGGVEDATISPPASGGSPCDVNGDGSADVIDVELEVDQALGIAACTIDINQDGQCDVIDVQRIVNAALVGICLGP